MKSEKLHLKNRRGQNIVGILTKPDSEIIGTAVLQHGYGSTKESASINSIQTSLLKNNFQVFNFDTTNSIGESDGIYVDARAGLHADDFEDVVDWTSGQDWYVEGLIVAGGSMGGFSALRYAIKNPKKVSYVIGLVPLVSGPLRIGTMEAENPGILKNWEEQGYWERESSTMPGLVRRNPWEYILDLRQHDLIPLASNLSMPVLLMSGELDTWIPSEHIQLLFENIPHKNKSFKIIKGAPHTMRNHTDQVMDIISKWLFQQLKK